MAEVSISLRKDQLTCSVCLDLLEDPGTIPCGHSYCMECIKSYWDEGDYVGVYSCPQCRQTFTPRPVLSRNTMLAQVAEKLKKSELQNDQWNAGPGDLDCDVCTGRKNKAVKSCLVCLASYCKTDLQLHNKLNRGKQHKLIDATRLLQDKICSHHNKLLEVYCRTDQQCICYLCMMGEHRGHDTVSAAAGRSEKQKQLEVTQREFQQLIQEREKEAQEFRQAVESFTRSAQAAVEETDSIFTEMIHSLKKRWSEVKDLIRAQEKKAVSQAKGPLKQLEQEIAKLKRTSAELEKFSHTQDHTDFLQYFQSACVPPQCEDLLSFTVNRCCSFGGVRNAVTELKDQIQDICKTTLMHISETVKDVNLLPTREQFLQYACELTLDPNTANKYLSLSENNLVATRTGVCQYPDHPDRFSDIHQVLCKEGLTGRCYWEVQWSGSNKVHVAVAYKGISRKGWSKSHFGHNDKSWSLICSPFGYYFLHNSKKTAVPGPCSSIVGVYLDHGAGTLSFYSVSDTITLLHRVQTSFSEPLYPGFWIQGSEFGRNFFVKLSSLKCTASCI